MKVPVWLFIFWAICLVGIVIGFGKSEDAFTIAGNTIWHWVGIACSAGFVIGIILYFAKVGGGKDK